MSLRRAIAKQSRGARERTLRDCFVAVLLAMTAGATFAQTLDVPYVATPPQVVDAMLELARVGPKDYLIDLGSGDGRIVITAAKKYGARGMGVDLDGGLVYNARREAERQGLREKVEFRAQNLFTADLGPANVVTAYLLPQVNAQLRPKLFNDLKPGSRVVSHEFDFGNWKPDARVTVPVPDKRYGPPSSNIYLWVMPVNSAGRWEWKGTTQGEVAIEQRFQELSGSGRIGNEVARIESGKVTGDNIELVLVSVNTRLELKGRVSGERLEGSARSAGVSNEWQAVRVARGRINID